MTVEVPRVPISTDAPPPGIQSLMESSGAPPPTEAARLVTPDGLAGLVWRLSCGQERSSATVGGLDASGASMKKSDRRGR